MARYNLRRRDASATSIPRDLRRRKTTKSTELSEIGDSQMRQSKTNCTQGRPPKCHQKLTTVSQEPSQGKTTVPSTSIAMQAHCHSQPIYSSAANGNHMIVIDLLPLNISMPTDMTKSFKLETFLHPYLLNDPNNNKETLPMYVCYTHVKETIVKTGHEPKPKSIPRGLDMPSLDFEPICSSTPSPAKDEVQAAATPKIVVKPRGRKAAVNRKDKITKRPKLMLNMNDILTQMIKDENIVTKYQNGEKLKVNIVERGHIGALKRNYRKSCYKHAIDKILSNPFPNTTWASNSLDNTSEHRSTPTVTVLSDIVVQSSRLEGQVSSSEQNGEQSPSSWAAIDVPDVSILSNTSALSTKSTSKMQRARKKISKSPVVDIFMQSDEDCSEVIEVLGPDYTPVVHRRKKKRGSMKMVLTEAWKEEVLPSTPRGASRKLKAASNRNLGSSSESDGDASKVNGAFGLDDSPVVRRRKKSGKTTGTVRIEAVKENAPSSTPPNRGRKALEGPQTIAMKHGFKGRKTSDTSGKLKFKAASNEGDAGNSSLRKQIASLRKRKPMVIIKRMKAEEMERYWTPVPFERDEDNDVDGD